MHTRRKTIGALLLLMLAIIPAWAPLTRPGLPQWRPGALPVLNLYAMARGERFDIALLPARILHLLGVDGVTAVKAGIILAMLLLALAIFFWARTLWDEKAGVLAAMLAVYAPVFLSSIYQTGAIAGLWLMAGVAMVGWGVFRRGIGGIVLAIAGAALALVNLPAALRPVAGFDAGPALYQLIEPAWFWDTTSINLQTPVAWSLGLPLLALLIIALWLSFTAPSHASAQSPLRILALVGLLLLLAAPFTPAQASLALILAAIPLLAVAAAGLLALTPVLQTPALWAALLLLPVLAAGPALSPDFAAYPIPEHPAAIFGDQQIMLIDVRPDSAPAPGQTVTLNAVWQATEPIDFDYNIFVHVVDDAGNLVAQLDTQPVGGDRPMTTWQPGEIIHDSYQLAIPPDAPSPLHLRMGLYNWQTLERLPLASGGDALTITP